MPGPIPAAARSAADSEKCDELNGVLARLSTPPRLVASVNSRSSRSTASARRSPPVTSTVSIAVPRGIIAAASSCCGWSGRLGCTTRCTSSRTASAAANRAAEEVCRASRTSKVCRPRHSR